MTQNTIPADLASPAAVRQQPPAAPRDAEVLATIFMRFEVYRSGAQFSLACRRCTRRCGSWRKIALGELCTAATRHQCGAAGGAR